MNFIEHFLLADSSDEEEFHEIRDTRLIRRQLRDNSNPLQLEDVIFKQRFRLTKEAFKFVEQKLHLKWGKTVASIPPILKLCATLQILSSGSYQSGVGCEFLIGMAQSTVSTIFNETLDIMERSLCSEFIKFEPSQRTKINFYQQFNFPGIVGCVDGTHVYHLKPTENEHSFLNRKQRHSLNVMVICDENMTIMAINGNYGGCNHDSFVWANSEERLYMEQYTQDNPNSFLLGDSGYPLEPWLITPYRAATENSPEAHFNSIHSKARCIIERCIGVWKGRWRILLSERQCRYKPHKVVQMCNITAALHNICNKFNITSAEIESNVTLEDENTHTSEQTVPSNRQRALAVRIRDRIRDSLIN